MGGCCVGNCCVMNNAVGDFFRDIFESGGGCGYHPGPSKTEAHAKKIADELAAMKETIREASEKKESLILDWINKSMNELIQELEKVNRQLFGGKSLNINIAGIRDKNEQLKKEVVGYIGNIMDDRLVLTDKELSVILEEDDDKKRAKNFDAFCQRVQKEALTGLSGKIESTVRKQEEMIKREIQARLNEVDKNMREANKAYTEIVNAKEHDKEKLETMRIKYIYKYELTEILLDQLKD
jgi:hypothetical protein